MWKSREEHREGKGYIHALYEHKTLMQELTIRSMQTFSRLKKRLQPLSMSNFHESFNLLALVTQELGFQSLTASRNSCQGKQMNF